MKLPPIVLLMIVIVPLLRIRPVLPVKLRL